MFPQLKKINNESGIILFIVLMTSIVIMIYSLGILTQSVNEINYAQQQIEQITADQLSKGIFWNSFATGMNTLPNNLPVSSTSVGGDTSAGSYSVSIAAANAGTITNGVKQYTVSTSIGAFN